MPPAVPERTSARPAAGGGGLRPRLSAQAARARSVAQRYHQRLLQAGARGPWELPAGEAVMQRALVLASSGLMAVFALWCALRAGPAIEADVARRVDELRATQSLGWLAAEVVAREVRLYGVTPSAEERDRALQAVGGLAAVSRVVDHIVVATPALPGTRPEMRPRVPVRVVMSFDGSRLTLIGQLGDEEGTTALLRQAEQRYTREGVVTELTTTREVSPRWLAAASAALSALALFDVGQAVLTEERLSVSGAAPDATTLGSIREVLRVEAPADLQLRADIVPLYRRGEVDPASCRRALAITLEHGELAPSPEFTGLSRAAQTTLDRVARVMQSCRAGLVIVVNAAATDQSRSPAGLAADLRRYLVTTLGLLPGRVALADGPATPAGPAVTLQLVFSEGTPP